MASRELEQPGSTLLQKLRRVKGVKFGAAGVSLGVHVDSLRTSAGATPAEVFVEFVRKAEGDAVLVIDEAHRPWPARTARTCSSP